MGEPIKPFGEDLRSYGRRHGRKLSTRQARLLSEDLPRLTIDLGAPPPASATALFPPHVRDIWLEIGFGGGEHLVWHAEHRPDVGLIGSEPFLDGVVKVVDAVQSRRLDNVRLVPDDVRPLLRWLPEACLGRAFILFPDPWPKARHRKRRLVSEQLLAMLARVMRPGSELRIATDIGDYARTVLLAMRAVPAFGWLAAAPSDWRRRGSGWPPTRYEQKALAAGRRPVYLRFERR
ncbi:MAG: tRNA (guanine(46)-N(7))-methyltransferase TrmB [Hyphomicrobiaceae bacterium]|nr:tRNA (guanine(46)-N(7))-methyltransferase TrmB [Hyphomicrobiaceae bacterium]